MLRTLTKTAFACAYTWTGSRGPDPSAMPFIAGYHRVVKDFDRSSRHAIPSLLISTGMLEKHIDWLAKRFNLVSLDEIGRILETHGQFARPTAAITFDDGYCDVYRNAYPLLKRKGIPAAVFVVTDLAGTSRSQVYDRLYLLLSRQGLRDPLGAMTALLTSRPQKEIERMIRSLEEREPIAPSLLEDMAPLSWEMITEMHRNGITIGSHTRSHTLLTQESLGRVSSELFGSRKALEEKLRASIRHFAYPDGRFNPLVVRAVAAAGYRFGYGICRVRDNRFPLLTIPRKVLWERACLNAMGRFSPTVMNCHTRWVFDGTGGCGHDHFGKKDNVAIN